jgi:hypothetical protein
MTIRDRMLEAQALIKARRYAEARQILRTVQHPKAREWEAKLNQIAPEIRPAVSTSRRRPTYLLFLAPVLIIIGAGIVVLLIAQMGVRPLDREAGITPDPVTVAAEPTRNPAPLIPAGAPVDLQNVRTTVRSVMRPVRHAVYDSSNTVGLGLAQLEPATEFVAIELTITCVTQQQACDDIRQVQKTLVLESGQETTEQPHLYAAALESVYRSLQPDGSVQGWVLFTVPAGVNLQSLRLSMPSGETHSAGLPATIDGRATEADWHHEPDFDARYRLLHGFREALASQFMISDVRLYDATPPIITVLYEIPVESFAAPQDAINAFQPFAQTAAHLWETHAGSAGLLSAALINPAGETRAHIRIPDAALRDFAAGRIDALGFASQWDVMLITENWS